MIKITNSDDHCEECMQYGYGEKYDLVDTEARDALSSSITSMIKCSTCMKNYGERIKKINKNIKTAVCPVHSVDEYLEHVILCKKRK